MILVLRPVDDVSSRRREPGSSRAKSWDPCEAAKRIWVWILRVCQRMDLAGNEGPSRTSFRIGNE